MPTNAARGGGSSGGGNGGGGGRRTKHRPKSPTDQVRVDREDILFGNGTDDAKGNYAHNGRNDDENKTNNNELFDRNGFENCLLYTSPSPRDMRRSRMPSSA